MTDTTNPKTPTTLPAPGIPTSDYLKPNLTEPAIERALIDAKGDLFLAAQLLGHVTVIRLDRSIRVSPRLQTVFLAIQEAKTDPEYERRTAECIESGIQRRVSLYRAEGLDALHVLATMPLSDNSAQNQVKLAAATRLASGTESGQQGSEIESTLAILNQSYHAAAPRIRSVRERIIEFDNPAPLPPAR